MATYSREKLSGSTNGRGIKVAATSTPGTTIHTAINNTSDWDEVYLWVVNTGAETELTLEFGGTTDPDDLLCKTLTIPANSPPIPIATGQILQNSVVVRAFAADANVLVIFGYVNRIDN